MCGKLACGVVMCVGLPRIDFKGHWLHFFVLCGIVVHLGCLGAATGKFSTGCMIVGIRKKIWIERKKVVHLQSEKRERGLNHGKFFFDRICKAYHTCRW